MSGAQSIGTPDNRAAKAAEAAPGKPSRARRIAHVLVAALVFVVLPMVLVGALVGEFGVGAMGMGLVLGVVGSKLGGTRRMAYVPPAIGVAGGLGAVTAYDWWWVALLATVGVIAGAGIRFGWMPTLLMLPYAATFVRPVSTGTDAVIYGAIAAIATGYGVVLARRFGGPDVVDGDRQPLPVAVVVAIVFGVVLGASAAVGVALGWTEPYWVPEPVLILVLYVLLGKRERIREKALGTALGVAGAIPVAILSPPAGVLTAVATVAFVVALTQAKRYWSGRATATPFPLGAAVLRRDGGPGRRMATGRNDADPAPSRPRVSVVGQGSGVGSAGLRARDLHPRSPSESRNSTSRARSSGSSFARRESPNSIADQLDD